MEKLKIWRIKATGHMAQLDVVTYGESNVLDAIKQVKRVGVENIQSVSLLTEMNVPKKEHRCQTR
jgi:hypothetical protein